MVEGVVCGAVGAGCWGLWRGCWAGVSGVPWGWVLGAAEGAIGGVVGVPQGEGAGGRGGGVWWGGTGRRGGGCWGLRWARWRRSAGAVGVGAGGRGEGGGGGQRGAVGVGGGSRGEAGRVRQTASINTPGPPWWYIYTLAVLRWLYARPGNSVQLTLKLKKWILESPSDWYLIQVVTERHFTYKSTCLLKW